MNDGQSGSIRPLAFCLLSPRQSELLAWYDMRLSEICTLTFIWQAFSPSTVIFAGIGVLLSVCILDNCVWDTVTHTFFQAAKDVRASQDTLVDVFERIEMFFRRLVVYTDVPPTTEMTDIITQIMVEVLCILGIATKEVRQSRLSELFSTSVPQ